MLMNFKILWPENRVVTSDQIAMWYSDAVANGEAEPGLTDIEEQARELDNIGHITLGCF